MSEDGKKLWWWCQKSIKMISIGLEDFIHSVDTNICSQTIMDTFNRTWQATELWPFITWNLPSHGSLWVGVGQFMKHVRIPLCSSIETWNPTSALNWNSRFSPLLSAQIPDITTGKKIITHITYRGPSGFCDRSGCPAGFNLRIVFKASWHLY